MHTQQSKAKSSSVIWGNWDTQTIQCDFDDTTLDEVLYWCFRALKWFKHDHLGKIDLEGFIVLQSSIKKYALRRKGKVYGFKKGSYHVVFNVPVDWSKNCHIRAWIALESGNENLIKYSIMQDIKERTTLRDSAKGKKSVPKIVFRYGFQDKQVKNFLETKKFILDFLSGRLRLLFRDGKAKR
jgi:hypothetical protein